MLLKDLLTEASTPQRAWNGKLKKIDALLAWMYDKDILTKTEKAKKDTIFRAYYRFYNDGDMPKALQLKGLSKWSSKEEKGLALEAYLETFIKTILTKYLPRVDRTEFRFDKLISDLATVISVSESHDVHGILTYWLKTVKINDPDSVLKQLVDTLQDQYKTLKDAADAAHPETSNYTMSYRSEKMKEAKKWNKSLERSWNEVKSTMDDITTFLKNLQSSIKDLKKQKIVSETNDLSESMALYEDEASDNFETIKKLTRFDGDIPLYKDGSAKGKETRNQCDVLTRGDGEVLYYIGLDEEYGGFEGYVVVTKRGKHSYYDLKTRAIFVNDVQNRYNGTESFAEAFEDWVTEYKIESGHAAPGAIAAYVELLTHADD